MMVSDNNLTKCHTPRPYMQIHDENCLKMNIHHHPICDSRGKTLCNGQNTKMPPSGGLYAISSKIFMLICHFIATPRGKIHEIHAFYTHFTKNSILWREKVLGKSHEFIGILWLGGFYLGWLCLVVS